MIGQKLVELVSKRGFNLPNWLFFLLKLKKIYKVKIHWLDQYQVTQELHALEPVLSITPQIHHVIPPSAEQYDLGVYLYLFENVLINIRSSSIFLLDKNELVMERVEQAQLCCSDYSGGFVRKHNAQFALTRFNRPQQQLGNVLFLGGNGCFNYYHWMIEIIPKIFYLNQEVLAKYQIDHILCEVSAQQMASFKVLLQLVLDHVGIDLPIVYVTTQKEIKLKKMLYINSFNNVVFNSYDIVSAQKYTHLQPAILLQLRTLLLAKLDQRDFAIPKIFLARRPSQARLYNQDAVFQLFEKYGFKSVYLDEYTLEQQISLFSQADFIVGPSGAAWSNLLFCKTGCQAISWLPEQLKDFSVFSTLAHIMQCDLRFVITCTVADTQDIHSNYEVYLPALEALYLEMQQ